MGEPVAPTSGQLSIGSNQGRPLHASCRHRRFTRRTLLYSVFLILSRRFCIFGRKERDWEGGRSTRTRRSWDREGGGVC